MALEPEEFAQRIRDLREAKAWSRERAARKLGLSPRQMARWEDAEVEQPHGEAIERAAQVFEVELEYLLGPSPNGKEISGRLERLEADLAELLGIVKDELVPSLAALEAARDAAEKGRSGKPSGRPRRSNGKT
jgi:transcriptional regulator with XRE-family HTH domain